MFYILFEFSSLQLPDFASLIFFRTISIEHGTGVELSVTRDEESDSDLDVDMDEETSTNCGLFSFRPSCLQKMATIQVFVFLSCVLVTLNQALSSGYFNRLVA